MNLHVAHEELMQNPAYRKEAERLARRNRKAANAHRQSPPPPIDAPLDMEIPESPHWPLHRARAERDRLATLLRDIHCRGESKFLIEAREAIDKMQFEPGRTAVCTLAEIIYQQIHRNTRAVHCLRRLSVFASYVAALENAAARAA